MEDIQSKPLASAHAHTCTHTESCMPSHTHTEYLMTLKSISWFGSAFDSGLDKEKTWKQTFLSITLTKLEKGQINITNLNEKGHECP